QHAEKHNFVTAGKRCLTQGNLNSLQHAEKHNFDNGGKRCLTPGNRSNNIPTDFCTFTNKLQRGSEFP
ncbi:MAG: hypothetical protein ACQETA_10820, partial [Bacteroidota bacterium]